MVKKENYKLIIRGRLNMDKKTIKKLIGKFDKKQLQELVTYIVSKSEQAREALLGLLPEK